MRILTINNKNEEKFLRKKTADFDFKKYSKKKLEEIIGKMRQTMIKAQGIGLSANQVGLGLRLFIAQIPEKDISINPVRNKISKGVNQPNQHKSAFYIIFNPKIKTPMLCNKKTKMEEGCLSVPGVYGIVERPEKIILTGQDIDGNKIRIKASGLLARVFQHETDHLNGILFIDRCKEVHKIPSTKHQITNKSE